MCSCNGRDNLLTGMVRKTRLDKIAFTNRSLNESFSRADNFHEGSMLIKHGLTKGFGRKLFFTPLCLAL